MNKNHISIGSCCFWLVSIIMCGVMLTHAAHAQNLVVGKVYTPAVGSEERGQLMDSVRTAMGSPASKYKVSWLTAFHGPESAIAVGVLDDIGAGLPVGTVFFEKRRDVWHAQYLVATDGSTECKSYVSVSERLISASKSIGAPSALFPSSFMEQYKEAKSGKSNDCMGFKIWGSDAERAVK